ncbi:MAG: bifunctional phosphopantothenoylcysteine decarboxylase/phosphopantothenate--cysteine ligase CoaBC [Deltaproteobacteria bacterium]|nr:bifunctional phosphopantothenoylcysteine decarboxylase/phosphopantothenate--cysteine ligase CoaBC [Deltaproteobacteria bacterium]
MLKGKTIVLGVTGGIAAYKSCELVRQLREAGAEVHVMMTKAAQEFVTSLTFQTLSGHPVQTNLFNLTEGMEIGHISLADKADLVVIAPATADILAKIAHGLCDDIVTTVICATKSPVLLAPSMNVHMWENPITQENVKKLEAAGYMILEPTEGSLACGYEGKGRLPEPETILEEIEKMLTTSKKLALR